MTRILLGIYRFFEKRKLWLAFSLIAVAVLVVLSIRSLRFSEDIMDLLPDEAGVGAHETALDASKFTERVVFHLQLDDSEGDVDLVQAGELLVVQLDSLQPNLLEKGPLKIENSNISELYDLVLDDLPYLMNESDFEYLDSLNNPQLLRVVAQRNFRNIVSPSGLLSAKFIVQDPLGLGVRVLKRLNSFNLDDNLQLIDGFLMTPDEKHLLLFAQPSFPANDSRLNNALRTELKSIAEEISRQFGGNIRMEFFGAPISAAVNAEQIKSDIFLTVSLAMVALLVVIFIFYRSFRVFFFILIPSAFGGAVSLAVFAWIGVPVSLISVSIGSILLGISVDYALHVFTHFRSKGEVVPTLKDVAEPVLLSSCTTAAAFFTLISLNAPAMQQLGIFAGTSVLVGSVTALILLPHLLTQKMNLAAEKRNSFVDRINGLRPDKNKWVVGAVVLLSMVFLIFPDDVGFEGDLLKMNYTTPELQQAEENLDQISNVSLKQVMLVSSGADWQEALSVNEELDHWLVDQKTKGRISERASVSAILPSPRVADNRRGAWQDRVKAGLFDTLQHRLSNLSQSLGMKPDAYADFFREAQSSYAPIDYHKWATSALFNNFIHLDSGKVKILTSVRMDQEFRPELTADAGDREGVAVLDKQYLTNQIIGSVQREFDQLVTFSLIVVFFLLLVVYGRIELAVFTFLPMMLAWVWTLGLMDLFDMKFNIFNIIVSTFIFGLGIDYSIFISRSMIQEYKYGHEDLVSYKNSIFLSAFTTMVGVGVLILAEHPALRSIAAMSLIGIGSMLIIAYTIQPLLYRWTMIDRKSRGLVPITIMNLSLGLFSLTYFFVGCVVLNVAIVLLQLVPVSGARKRAEFRRLMSLFLGSLAGIMANVRREYLNPHNETFEKPAVIIANHQSFIDILITLNIQPNMVMVVKKWVHDSPLFGWAVRYAGHFHVNDGYENALPQLRKRVEEGCSIVVFPEGTRSVDGTLGRFHKGAFFLSEQLKLDIVPIIIHGNHYSMSKNDSLILKNGFFHRVILERIPHSDRSLGETYQERTKTISGLFKRRFAEARREFETPGYFRDQLICNYVLKGPILEWYTRIKTRLENNYSLYEQLLPRKGIIVDIGCGYGYLAHILAWTSEDRTVFGYDHDENKIAVAQNTPTPTPNLTFAVGNALNDNLPEADAYTLIDVLHYLPEGNQRQLISKCIRHLRPGGIVLIRDADADLKKRHRGTWLTEFFSTRLGFNKTNSNDLCFVSREFISSVAAEQGGVVEVIDNSRLTSNVIYKITKPGD